MEVGNVDLEEYGSSVCIHRNCEIQKQLPVVSCNAVLALRAGCTPSMTCPQRPMHVSSCGALTSNCFMLHPSWTDMVDMQHQL